MAKSRIPFALILISIAVILGTIIAMYLLLDSEIAKIKSDIVTPTPTTVAEATAVPNENNYTQDYLVYLDGGELFSMKYDGSEQKQLTESDGSISSFTISPDNQYLAYTVAQEYGFGEIPSAHAAKFTDRNKKTFINTAAYELNLSSGESTQLLAALADNAYETELKRAQIKPFAYTGIRSNISGLNYIPYTEGRYLVYSRYEDISTDLEQALNEKIADSAFVLDVISGEADKIIGQPWITAVQWSASGDYAIFSDYDHELYRDTIYNLTTLPIIKRVSSTTRFEFGTMYSFLKDTDTVVELGTEFTSTGSVNIYREIDPATKKVIKDEKPNDFSKINIYRLLSHIGDTSFVLSKHEDSLKIYKYAPEQELVFDNATKLGGEHVLTDMVGTGKFSTSMSEDALYVGQWYSVLEGKLTVYIYDLANPDEAVHTFELTPVAPNTTTPDLATTLQFFHPTQSP